jgi:hypothetical protein
MKIDMNTPEEDFLQYLRWERGYICATQVAYGGIADILAVDRYKQHVIEYEFKRSRGDLRYAEKKKLKYTEQEGFKTICGKPFYVKGQVFPVPHRFYYVIPMDMWESEKEWIEKEKVGCVCYYEKNDYWRYVVKRRCQTRKKNVQKYLKALEAIALRLGTMYLHEVRLKYNKEWKKEMESTYG